MSEKVTAEIEKIASDMASGGGSSMERFDQAEAKVAELPRVELEPTHHFSDGLYGRELAIPAGVVLTGKIHAGETLNIIPKGDITVFSADEGTRRIRAPFTFVSKPGTRRIGFAHEDTIWITVHKNPSNTRNLEQLEAELIIPHTNPLLNQKEAPCLGGQ